MRPPDLTLVEEFTQVSGHLHLARVRARGVDALVERDGRAPQCFQRHCACHVCDTREPFRAIKSEAADRRHRLRPVQERETFLGFQ